MLILSLDGITETESIVKDFRMGGACADKIAVDVESIDAAIVSQGDMRPGVE